MVRIHATNQVNQVRINHLFHGDWNLYDNNQRYQCLTFDDIRMLRNENFAPFVCKLTYSRLMIRRKGEEENRRYGEIELRREKGSNAWIRVQAGRAATYNKNNNNNDDNTGMSRHALIPFLMEEPCVGQYMLYVYMYSVCLGARDFTWSILQRVVHTTHTMSRYTDTDIP